MFFASKLANDSGHIATLHPCAIDICLYLHILKNRQKCVFSHNKRGRIYFLTFGATASGWGAGVRFGSR